MNFSGRRLRRRFGLEKCIFSGMSLHIEMCILHKCLGLKFFSRMHAKFTAHFNNIYLICILHIDVRKICLMLEEALFDPPPPPVTEKKFLADIFSSSTIYGCASEWSKTYYLDKSQCCKKLCIFRFQSFTV